MKFLLLLLLTTLIVVPSEAEENDYIPFSPKYTDPGTMPFAAPIQMTAGPSTYDALAGSSGGMISDDVLSLYSTRDADENFGTDVSLGFVPSTSGLFEMPEASELPMDPTRDLFGEIRAFQGQHDRLSLDLTGMNFSVLDSPYTQFQPPIYGSYQTLSDLMNEQTFRK